MGPPGGGKTTTLGEVVRAAFEDGRRVLVCSNTNKAVDQLLLKICGALTIEHEAMLKGQVVRLGRIVDEKLRLKYASFVTVDGIVARLSKDLNERRLVLEEEIAGIDARVEHTQSLIARFETLDRAEQVVTVELLRVNELARKGKGARDRRTANHKLRADLLSRRGA